LNQSVEVLYFAMLAEAAQKNHESLVLAPLQTPRKLYSELAKRYSFDLSFDQIRVAVNDQFVRSESPLESGDRVAFIPPVSGG
jgi:molybdopterin synthase sulfur carrier subunit